MAHGSDDPFHFGTTTHRVHDHSPHHVTAGRHEHHLQHHKTGEHHLSLHHTASGRHIHHDHGTHRGFPRDTNGEHLSPPLTAARHHTHHDHDSHRGFPHHTNEDRRYATQPVEHGFSFSLTDLPDAPWALRAAHSLGRGHVPPSWSWNPLETVRWHWAATPATPERRRLDDGMPTIPTPPAAGLGASLRAAAYRATSVEEELYRREARSQELRSRIALLQAATAADAAGVAAHSSSSSSGSAGKEVVRISVVAPLPGERMLGIVVKGLTVLSVDDPRATSMGWQPADRVLAVNGKQVTSDPDFAEAIATALRGHRATGHPLVFDVLRSVPLLEMPRATPPAKRASWKALLCCECDSDSEAVATSSALKFGAAGDKVVNGLVGGAYHPPGAFVVEQPWWSSSGHTGHWSGVGVPV